MAKIAISTLVLSILVSSSAQAQLAPRVDLRVETPAGESLTTVDVAVTVSWQVRAKLYSASLPQLGIAGFALELVQQSGPGPLTIIGPAVRPPELAAFDRPLGFATLDTTGTTSGFGGFPQSNGFGGQDLLSIGGGVNTTGVALPAAGGIGTSAVVVSGVALQPTGQVLVTGTLTVPLKVGPYSVGFRRAQINVLGSVGGVGVPSQVLVAEDFQTALSIVVVCRADFNHDNALSVQDIFDFLAAWFGGLPSADFNGGGLSIKDVFDFLGACFLGCEF